MDRDEIIARVCTVVADVADDLNHVLIRPGAQLQADLGLDSFDRVDLLNQIEDEFAVSLPHPLDRQLTQPDTTVLQLVQAVEQQLAKKGIAA